MSAQRLYYFLSSTAGVCLGLVLQSGCTKPGAEAPKGGADIAPQKVNLKRGVELDVADRRALDYTVEATGWLEAESQPEIAAGVSGLVDEVLAFEGDYVEAGTVLIKVDQRKYVNAANVAKANESRGQANLLYAQREVERTRDIRGQAISQEERDRAVQALGVAEAELRRAQSERVLAEHNLDRSWVRAPFTGQINQRKVAKGMHVEDKTTVYTMADLTRIRLVGWVPETAAATVRQNLRERQRVQAARLFFAGASAYGLPCGGLAAAAVGLSQRDPTLASFDPEFTLLALPQRMFRARVFYLSTTADPQTHMFECKAEVDLTSVGDAQLLPGYTADIKFPLRSNPDACVIPEESVRASERGFIAFIPTKRTAKDGAIEWIAKARVLELGFRSPGWVEVRKGITPGEPIVRRGAEALEDGTPIRFPESQTPKDGN